MIDCDLNDDDRVDFGDIVLALNWWLEDTCSKDDNDFCGWSDFDLSGRVDLGDIAVIADHWLEE